MAEQAEKWYLTTRRRMLESRPLRWVGGGFAALLLLLFIGSFFLDEPLRKTMETNINRDLKGYSVRLPALHFQLIGFSLTLKGLTVQQQAHPSPPVAHFPSIKAGIHWREIFSGSLVGEIVLDDPKLHINLLQLKNEAESKTPLKEKGWQEAIGEIYPLKINVTVNRAPSITPLLFPLC